MKKSIMLLLLALVTPMMSWGTGLFHSKHYGKVTVTASGNGTVYVSDSNSATSGNSSYTWNCGKSSNSDTKTVYCFAKPADGYKFVGWKDTGLNDSPRSVSHTAVSTSENSPTELLLTAEFAPKVVFNVTLEKSNGGSYMEKGSQVNADRVYTFDDNYSMTLSAPQPADGYEFVGWYKRFSNGQKEIVSYFETCTILVKEAGVYGVEFRKLSDITLRFQPSTDVGYTIDGTTSVTDEEVIHEYTKTGTKKVTLATIAAVSGQPRWWYKADENSAKMYFSYSRTAEHTFTGSAIVGVDFDPGKNSLASLIENTENNTVVLDSDAGILDETTVVIPEGMTVTVPEGKTLYVDGVLMVNGTLEVNGTISTCRTLLKQKGNGLAPLNPYGSVKYWKTSSTMPSSSVVNWNGTLASHVTVMRGDGVAVRKIYSDTPAVLKCEANADVAANHIVSITSTDTAKTRTNDSLTCPPSGEKNSSVLSESGINNILVIVAEGVKIAGQIKKGDSQNRYYYQGVVDCAGFSCGSTIGDVMSDYITTYLNGNGVTAAQSTKKFQNASVRFCNCSNITNGKLRGSPYLIYFDCEISPLSFSAHSDGGAAVVRFYSGKYDYDFNASFNDTKTRIYGGAFKTKPEPSDKWIAESLQSTMKFCQRADGYWYLEENQEPYVVRIGSEKKETLEEAFAYLDKNNEVEITLLKDITVAKSFIIPAGKKVTLELNGCHIDAPAGFVENYGSLSLREQNNRMSVSGITTSGEGKCIVKNFAGGNIDICYGLYNGDFSVQGGTLTVHHGKFSGGIMVADGEAVLKGGIYSTDVSSLQKSGYQVFNYGGLYYVGEVPNTVAEKSSLTDFAYKLSAMPSLDKALYVSKKNHSLIECSDEAEWKRVAELKSAYDLFADKFNIDIILICDRDVAAGTLQAKVNVAGITKAVDVTSLEANATNRLLSSNITQSQIGYYRFIDDQEHKYDSLEAGVQSIDNVNKGTTCRLLMDLWHYKSKTDQSIVSDLVIVSKSYVFGAGNNVAMLQTSSGAVPDENFFQSLADAVAADATMGQTIKLCNDSAESVVVLKECVIDVNGFKFTGSVVAGDGYKVECGDSGVYTVRRTKSHTETTAVPMPLEEIASRYAKYLEAAGGDYEKAAVAIGKNGRPVWESWLIGLDTENAEDKDFTAKLEMVDGKPVITWTPDLNEGGKKSVRKYTILGSSNLENWVEVSAGQEKDYNFFKVSVAVE